MTPRPLAATLALLAGSAFAQTYPPPQNVVSLTGSATVEVPKDVLQLTFTTTRDGADAQAVQSQLKQAVDAALAELRKAAKPGQIDVRSGAFGLYPRYAPKGGIAGWQGSAEVVVEGKDVPGIAALAGKVPTMAVGRLQFSLSREAREKVEGDVTTQAIASYRQKADFVSKQFGYGGYTIRELSVTLNDAGGGPVPMFRAQAAAASADAPLPVEAGKAAVTATVSGSIVMSPGR